MLEVVRISETSVHFNFTTQLYIPEDSKLNFIVCLYTDNGGGFLGTAVLNGRIVRSVSNYVCEIRGGRILFAGYPGTD
jgi:hypothetical protein